MKYKDLLSEDGRIVKGVNTTVDVGVGQIPIEARKFGNSVDKDGRPPTLSKRVKGKSTNVLYNLGLTEGVMLKFQRGEDFDTLHIKPKGKNRVELRGKPGYERGNYDAQDKLHQVLDKLGKAANFAELMNGETVSINPNHPDGERATKTAQDILSTENNNLDAPTPTIQMLARKWKTSPKEILTQLKKGVKVEAEHTTDFDIAMEIALDHINEDLKYYDKLKKVEEADGLGEIASSSQIYVDMDGVLADFFGEWARLMDVEHFTDINKQHDINDALQKIRDTDDFWLRLPMLPESKNLLNLIKQVKGSYNICSSPLADDPNSEKHKRTWIEQNLNFFPPDNVYITHDKAQYATNEDGTPNILIDDYGVNIRKWEAAGGIGFKYKDHKFERTADAIKQHMQEPVEENFADGKKKGKSRPGRVKRAGASCNGSVTALRKRAKNASGEKARMYHWCANMKSGRKKS
jgi:5'(3')-deoxyribonucleotidase